MSKAHRRVLLCWLGLLALGVVEFGGSFIRFSAELRPLLLVPAIGMVGLVAIAFMRVGHGVTIVRCFALGGLLWLLLLLGLGTMDPLTRTVYVAHDYAGSQ